MENDKSYHGNKWMPIMYATYYGIMKDIAKEYGYAIALHGTMVRDLDLIAIPWVENPKSIIDMMHEFNNRIGECKSGLPYDSFCNKPNGRVAYTICTGGGGYIDLSVIQLKQDNPPCKIIRVLGCTDCPKREYQPETLGRYGYHKCTESGRDIKYIDFPNDCLLESGVVDE